MNDRYFIVHWLAQAEPDFGYDDDLDEDEEYENSVVRGKLFVRTGGRYVNEEGLIRMVLDARPDLILPYIDRVDELPRSDYEDYIRGNPNIKLDEMVDPYSPRDFA